MAKRIAPCLLLAVMIYVCFNGAYEKIIQGHLEDTWVAFATPFYSFYWISGNEEHWPYQESIKDRVNQDKDRVNQDDAALVFVIPAMVVVVGIMCCTAAWICLLLVLIGLAGRMLPEKSDAHNGNHRPPNQDSASAE